MKIARSLFLTSTMLVAAEKKIPMESLPAAVQSAVKQQTQGATILGISSEKEKGRMTYEVETKVAGKSRDLTFDSLGSVIESEDEVDFDSLPAAAKAAIQRRTAAGTIVKVEKLTAGSKISYEASVKTKAGKNIEIGVNADGTPHKE